MPALSQVASTKPLNVASTSPFGYGSGYGNLPALSGQNLTDMLYQNHGGGYNPNLYSNLDTIGGRNVTNQYVNDYSPGGAHFQDWLNSRATGLPIAGTNVTAQQVANGVNALNTPPAPPGATASGATGTPVSDNFQNLGTGTTPTDNTDWSTVDINKFLNPNVDFLTQQGEKALQSSAAARGGLLSGNTLKGISDYAQNTAQAQSFQPAVQNALADRSFQRGVYQNNRDFGYNADVGDRNFFYNAQQNDRNYNTGLQQWLAQMGLGATNGQAGMQETLARLLSANGLAAAQAQGAGTIGANNSVTNAISQIISQLYGNNMLSQLGFGGP